MRMPAQSAHYSQHVRYGRYLARRLRRAGKDGLATDVSKVTRSVLAAGRAWEDADEPVQDALADRDGADDDLDSAAKTARAALAGRSANAMREAPYNIIFYKGLDYYTAAPVSEEVERYADFEKRLEAHLPEKDEVRVKTVKAIRAGLAEYAKASQELSVARNAEALAGSHLETAVEGWERLIEKTYGALVGEFGRDRAEAFFPKVKTKKGGASGGGEGEGGGAGTGG